MLSPSTACAAAKDRRPRAEGQSVGRLRRVRRDGCLLCACSVRGVWMGGARVACARALRLVQLDATSIGLRIWARGVMAGEGGDWSFNLHALLGQTTACCGKERRERVAGVSESGRVARAWYRSRG
eukprot:990747-Pleurochrysis_carterae.AAC.1